MEYWGPDGFARMVKYGWGFTGRDFFWIYIALCELVNKN